ncbi:MAG TPA: SCO family protein [Longimicrobiales bacterium]
MTIYQINSAARILLAMTLMALLLTSCGSSAPHPARASSDVAREYELRGAQPADPAVSEFSIYDLPSRWQDQQGLTLSLGDLSGRPRVLALVYTSCAHACPRILKDMKRIEGELRAAGIDAGYVMVSIDPARDTPQRLAAYAASTLLDPNDWTLLTGTEDGVLELAALLDVRYRRVSGTDFEHSNVITLLDPAGRIVHRQRGLGAEPVQLVRAAAAM